MRCGCGVGIAVVTGRHQESGSHKRREGSEEQDHDQSTDQDQRPATAALLLAHSEASGKRLAVTTDDISLEPELRCAAQNAVDPKRPASERILYVSLLVRFEWDFHVASSLKQLVSSERDIALRTAAVRALATFDHAEVPSALLAPKRLAALSPAEREVTLSALLARPAHVPRVLDAVEAATLPRNAIGAAQRTALSKSKDTEVRERAAKLFGAPADGDRMKAYEAAKAVLALAPNAAHGKEPIPTTTAPGAAARPTTCSPRASRSGQ